MTIQQQQPSTAPAIAPMAKPRRTWFLPWNNLAATLDALQAVLRGASYPPPAASWAEVRPTIQDELRGDSLYEGTSL